ncbi:MAG: 16S rRNA (guanine(527)-N(7))-methyltransferase RsmG [Lewinellaceae bacterium]|nr:16S rRNA (guanine(527)-N(7))-methyltransferase RsmG [Phaeodactylibacter sp.]MCB9037748.1 16S rRNA (guanine(527)-N(7))-methyltransferase RsmG [Lewinellaceae bacterium]
MEILLKYFPQLTEQQQQQLAQLGALYKEWNEKINVISRKDIDNVYDHHILHSLGITRLIHFAPGAEILDLGTGGGLPGIPLAIFFPKTKFTLIDGTRKKILVAEEIIGALELANVKARHIRAEELKQKFDFVVCRAVASLDKLAAWSFPLIKRPQQHALPNGLITLKGGDVMAEIKALPRGSYTERYALSDFFEEAYYQEKYIIYVQH